LHQQRSGLWQELDGALVIVVRVDQTHPSVGFGGYQNQLLVGAALSQKALKLNPEPADAEKIRQKVASGLPEN
jgi:hypothetical protein